MSFHAVELSTALRPLLQDGEHLIFVQDLVGLYSGKAKIPTLQNGQVYLTSHRICYVDDSKPRELSVAIELRDVDRHEHYGGFLKSSPKITLHMKTSETESGLSISQFLTESRNTSDSPAPLSRPQPSIAPPSVSRAPWVCPVCFFSNTTPANFDITSATQSAVPPCLSCGVKPPLSVLQAAAELGSRSNSGFQTPESKPMSSLKLSRISPPPPRPRSVGDLPSEMDSDFETENQGTPCPQCTFLNDPQMLNCEMCGSPLGIAMPQPRFPGVQDEQRAQSALSMRGPAKTEEGGNVVKLSFRNGGSTQFYERLKEVFVQRRWILDGPVPKLKKDPLDSASSAGSATGAERQKERQTAGIAGLERRGLDVQNSNIRVLGSAFDDLETLMNSAKELRTLAESFASMAQSQPGEASAEANELLLQSTAALNLVTTKSMMAGTNASEATYLSELARSLAEFLADDTRGILKREGGIMSLVDLWAVFNRARGGAELISPADMEKAARLWEKLHLPLRIRKFKSGVLVVHEASRTEQRTIASIIVWIKSMAPGVHGFGRGISPLEAAEHFGWSVGVATEELQMAEDAGALCRDESIEGIRFFENLFVS